MNAKHPSGAGPESRLDEILAAYWQAVEAGMTPDRQALLARHPDFTAELTAFFADLDRVEQVAQPLRAIKQALAGSLPAAPGAGAGSGR
jgi:hypothetical protein